MTKGTVLDTSNIENLAKCSYKDVYGCMSSRSAYCNQYMIAGIGGNKAWRFLVLSIENVFDNSMQWHHYIVQLAAITILLLVSVTLALLASNMTGSSPPARLLLAEAAVLEE